MLPEFLTNMDPAIYESKNYVVLDFETDTSHGDYGNAIHDKNGVLLASWKVGKQGRVRSTWSSEFELQALIADIEAADFIVAHNAKYELKWLRRAGLDLYNTLAFDTQLGEYVLFGNLIAGDDGRMPRRSTSLDMCCRRRGLSIKDPVVDIMMKNGINPKYMPRAWLQGRCEQDVDTTEALFESQLKDLQATNRLGVLFTRCIFTPFLGDTEFQGMCLDPERVEEEYVDYTERYVVLEKEMNEVTGNINWKSPLQVGEFIYETMGFEELKGFGGKPKRTKAGRRLTDKKTLEKLTARNKKQRDYIDLKGRLGKVSAALSKNLEFFVGVCREMGGIFYADYNQAQTATHRLSSSGIKTWFETFKKEKTVQFQNLPRVFKRLFRARKKGWLMAETDGSQLEFRTGVHQSKDVQGKIDIESGHDVHRFTASVINSVEEDEVTKEQRQDAKPHTFKPVYGGQSGTPAEQRYYKAFRERYPELAHTQESWVYDVVNHPKKRLTTEWGMRYYWPWAKLSRSGYCNYTSSIYNYPIQALATAEIIPIAVTFFWQRVKAAGLEDKIIIVNTIHDSIICEIHPDVQEQYKEISIQAFTFDVYEYLEKVYGVKFDWVPLGVGVTIGEHWSEGEEESYNVYHNGIVQQEIDGEFVTIEERKVA